MQTNSKTKRFLTSIGKVFNFCWKAGTILIGVALLITLIDSCADWIKRKTTDIHYYWEDETLGEHIEVHHFDDNTCFTYNTLTGKRISPKVRWISGVPQRDSLTVFCDLEGKRGFININTGEIVIEAQYKHAWHFSEGLAAVVDESGKVGFINHNAEMVIPANIAYDSEREYIFANGICVIRDCESGLFGAIDSTGKTKFESIYKRITLAEDGSRSVFLTLDGVKQQLSLDGEVLQPFLYDEIWPLRYVSGTDECGDNIYEIHPYLLEVLVDYGCHGVMDSRSHKMIIPAIYSNIEMVGKDLILAELDNNEENNILFNSSGTQLHQK